MKRFFCLVLYSLNMYSVRSQEISLNGQWTVRLDSTQETRSIQLPGTLDDAGIGSPNTVKPGLDMATMVYLARKVEYIGKAYYTRSFTVPASWKSKKITLTLGRVLWRSSITIDGKPLPESEESLVTSHQYDLTQHILPGKKHTITICIDNSNIHPGINVYGKQYPVPGSKELAHAYTNHTQIKWNGILGGLTLTAKPLVAIQQVKIVPDLSGNEIKVQYSINNPGNQSFRIQSYVVDTKSGRRWPGVYNASVQEQGDLKTGFSLAKDIVYWSEFTPRLYQLVSIVQSASGADTVKTTFGVREFASRSGELYLNNQQIFVRGNLECVIFPLKGYPPMTLKEWKDLFTKAKLYGLNTFRFHSWCPPGVAFQAADEIGFYLQVELPHWSLNVGEDMASFNFLRREANRILETYGNHPSFLFFSLGNELEGDYDKLNDLVGELKKKDNRHLYSTTTFTFHRGKPVEPQPQDEFYVTQWTNKGWVRGQGVFNDEKPDFSKDYIASLEGLRIPIISHEIGQYAVFPDLSEISKYKGNLVPKNMIAVRTDMTKKGLVHLAPAYLKATGKFATLLYKEEIERAFKTKGFDGFHLLQLQDFPGQGTALVGLLNAFWESKGVVEPADFRQYCSEVTPLIRFPKAVYSSAEIFKADIELANFYRPLPATEIVWKINDDKGKVLLTGSVTSKDYPVGNCLSAGSIQFDLKDIRVASRLQIEVSVKGTTYRNKWGIWVFPAELKEEKNDVVITTSLEEALQSLDNGHKVLLCPLPDTLNGLKGKFVPVFWSPVHFNDPTGTMGLLIRNEHKSLSDFPTTSHSDWQWWDLTKRSKTLVAEGLPEKAIIVRVIDNFMRNRNLTNLFEAKVGKGSLVFCSIDIMKDLDNRLEAKQLRYSLLNYMNSPFFKPAVALMKDNLRGFFK